MAKLPEPWEGLLTAEEKPAVILDQMAAEVGRVLKADRCFLYVRRPGDRTGRIAFCWRANDTVPDVTQPEWTDESSLPGEGPLYAAALAARPSLYVDDVETAPPAVLNRDFEARTFGHRALIHAHIVHEGELRGILQPCLFGRPRHWTDADRSLIELVLPRLAPLVIAFAAET